MIGSKIPGMFQTAARGSASAALLGFVLASGGCGQPASSPPAGSTTGTAAESHAHDGIADGHAAEAGDEVAAALAKLSADDRALADTQKVCVVSAGELGSMGTPVKVEHDGKTYFLCCEHCREPFEKDPEGFIAKLNAGPAGGDAAGAAPAADGAATPATEPAAETTKGS